MGRHNVHKKSVRFHRQQPVNGEDKQLINQVSIFSVDENREPCRNEIF